MPRDILGVKSCGSGLIKKELGIGRPYLDRDPPHVAPIDGQEYADKRGAAKARLAGMKRPSLSSSQK